MLWLAFKESPTDSRLCLALMPYLHKNGYNAIHDIHKEINSQSYHSEANDMETSKISFRRGCLRYTGYIFKGETGLLQAIIATVIVGVFVTGTATAMLELGPVFYSQIFLLPIKYYEAQSVSFPPMSKLRWMFASDRKHSAFQPSIPVSAGLQPEREY